MMEVEDDDETGINMTSYSKPSVGIIREKLLNSPSWKQSLQLNQLYNERIDNSSKAILQENFEELALSIE